LSIFRKSVGKNQGSLKSDKNGKHFNKDLFAFMIIPPRVLFRIINILCKIYRENQNTNFIFNTFFRKLCRLWDNVEKYCTPRQAKVTIKNSACVLHAG